MKNQARSLCKKEEENYIHSPFSLEMFFVELVPKNPENKHPTLFANMKIRRVL